MSVRPPGNVFINGSRRHNNNNNKNGSRSYRTPSPSQRRESSLHRYTNTGISIMCRVVSCRLFTHVFLYVIFERKRLPTGGGGGYSSSYRFAYTTPGGTQLQCPAIRSTGHITRTGETSTITTTITTTTTTTTSAAVVAAAIITIRVRRRTALTRRI